jgi:DNA-binding HTH domain-containing proteins
MQITRERVSAWTKEGALVALIVFQAACTSLFVADVFDDIKEAGHITLHLNIELFANIGLIAGIAVEAVVLWKLLRRQAMADRALSAAQGAMAELMVEQFRNWGLTAAEADVASFTIKGFTIAETADLRGSSEATVKSHLNAVYRKAGVSGRAQLVSVFVEELFHGPIRADAALQQAIVK